MGRHTLRAVLARVDEASKSGGLCSGLAAGLDHAAQALGEAFPAGGTSLNELPNAVVIE